MVGIYVLQVCEEKINDFYSETVSGQLMNLELKFLETFTSIGDKRILT